MSARLLEIGQFCTLLPFCEPRFDVSALLHEVRLAFEKLTLSSCDISIDVCYAKLSSPVMVERNEASFEDKF